jgi:four helix bundle protein
VQRCLCHPIIAEGFARSGPGEYKQYLYIAHGSLAELMTQIMLAMRLGYLNQEKGNETVDETEQISRMTATLIKRVGAAAAAGE